MSDGGATMFDMEVDVEVFEFLVIKLPTIISNNNSKKTELGDNGFSNKFPGFALSA